MRNKVAIQNLFEGLVVSELQDIGIPTAVSRYKPGQLILP